MNRDETVEFLTRAREAREKWGRARTAFFSDYEAVLSRLLHEAAVNYMSPQDVSEVLGVSTGTVRTMLRQRGLDPRASRTLLSKQAAAAMLENSALLGIEPSEMDLMSPLAYLPMGSQMRRELADQSVSKVTDVDGVSGNVEDTITHIVISNESGTWCREDCPRPEDECGALAVVWNAR